MILAGSILHVSGLTVINRIQTAGLGNVRVPIDTIREVGNPNIVDKIPGDPDFTFTLESLDMTADLEALLAGRVGTSYASAGAPAQTDAVGTEYPWGPADINAINIVSPWKDATQGASAGIIQAGHIIPGYYPRRLRYTFGATANASQQVELGGGSFYYAGNGDGTSRAPVEEFATGTGAQTAFNTANVAVPYRVGGAGGTTFKSVFGVLVNNVIQVDGVDFTQTPSNSSLAATATITFVTAPANGAKIRYAYFTTAAQTFPSPPDQATTTVTPAAVRGRNICVYIGSGATKIRIGGVQAATLEATVDATNVREMCNTEIIGQTVNGTNVTGDISVLSRDPQSLLKLFSQLTGVATSEVLGWLNVNPIPLQFQIQNPKNPGSILKTLYIPDAIVQIPGTEARVNQATQFQITFESSTGVYSAFKGLAPTVG